MPGPQPTGRMPECLADVTAALEDVEDVEDRADAIREELLAILDAEA